MTGILRPLPDPDDFEQDLEGVTVPAPTVLAWIHAQLLAETGALYNKLHAHLCHAQIGVLWTSVPYFKQGRRVLGTAEMPTFRCNAWQKARQEQQLKEWFGLVPDFVITLDAHYCLQSSDMEFCALVEHELLHCAQAQDGFGSPKFSKETGLPLFALRGHDVEEFVGVVERYGVGDPEGPLARMVEAANSTPSVSGLRITQACGTCLLKSA